MRNLLSRLHRLVRLHCDGKWEMSYLLGEIAFEGDFPEFITLTKPGQCLRNRKSEIQGE
ncbi:MAG: hypothetical protein IBX40_12495 [Methanosarcinales archaeon]|nr:hypothetical protein [Methanosarcinales archaeon]